MSYSHQAQHANHVGAHVAMTVVRYMPSTGISADVRRRFQPWECAIHCNDGGPRRFFAFWGMVGEESRTMIDADEIVARLAKIERRSP